MKMEATQRLDFAPFLMMDVRKGSTEFDGKVLAGLLRRIVAPKSRELMANSSASSRVIFRDQV